ncbi:MAG: bifunctional adenosylcobinamide kinase/adenosylcobinamide-phosphate guanylyltransferase [Dehalococcoidia bacterium]
MGESWFVTGGARSGKSGFAQRLAASTGLEVVFIATLEALDEEMEIRIARHQAERPPEWLTIEAPLDPRRPLDVVSPEACVLLDCWSLWVSNRLLRLGGAPSADELTALETELVREVDAILEVQRARSGPLVSVSNEVGSGVVPDSVLGRAYRDLLGRVNQRASASAERAWLLVAGRALELPPPAS